MHVKNLRDESLLFKKWIWNSQKNKQSLNLFQKTFHGKQAYIIQSLEYFQGPNCANNLVHWFKMFSILEFSGMIMFRRRH